MKGGTTGTARGGTRRQRARFMAWLVVNGIDELHVGDCVGWDVEAAQIARALHIRVVCHPPDVGTYRAYFRHYAEMRPPLPFLDRDQAIVDETAAMYAAPSQQREVLRSGTWATVRRAWKKHGKGSSQVRVVTPW